MQMAEDPVSKIGKNYGSKFTLHPTELAIEHYKGKFENSEAEKISNRITFASLSILID